MSYFAFQKQSLLREASSGKSAAGVPGEFKAGWCPELSFHVVVGCSSASKLMKVHQSMCGVPYGRKPRGHRGAYPLPQETQEPSMPEREKRSKCASWSMGRYMLSLLLIDSL